MTCKRERGRGAARLTAIAAAALLAAPSTALATTVYPAGDDFELATATVALARYNAVTCEMSGAAGTVPAAPDNSSSGPIRMSLTTPTFDNCAANRVRGIVDATAVGAWRLDLARLPLTTATIVIPAGGFEYRILPKPGCKATNLAEVTISGSWANGLVSPLVDSIFAVDGPLDATWVDEAGGTCEPHLRGNPAGMTFQISFVTVSNTTNPASPILVGP